MSELSREEVERYSRQILYSGKKGQIALKNARVLALGAGGIGSAMLPYLAAAGVGYIRLVEPDQIERSNLSRQILYQTPEVGLLKGAVARNKLMALNPEGEIEWVAEPFGVDNAGFQMREVDLVLEGTDDLVSKFLVNDLCLRQGVPALIGALGPAQGHVFPVIPQKSGVTPYMPGGAPPCYRCLFGAPPENPGEIPTCATEGILSPLAGVIGSMMAYRAVRFFIEGRLEPGIDIMEKNRWRSIQMKQNPGCPVCKAKTEESEKSLDELKDARETTDLQ